MTKRARKTPRPHVKAGDTVLVGGGMPSHWFFAKVLWADGEFVCTEHQAPSNYRCVQTLGYDSIVAAGTFESLHSYKERCVKEVKELEAAVREAESALGAARDAVWKRIDEMHLSTKKRAAE